MQHSSQKSNINATLRNKRAEMNDACHRFWCQFLKEQGKPADTKLYECFSFGASEQLADTLLGLVLSGHKTATCSSLLCYKIEKRPTPQVGNLSTLRFKEMTFELCRKEGEDDSLQSWQAGHEAFFMRDAKALGYEFSPDMPIIFEEFSVIFRR